MLCLGHKMFHFKHYQRPLVTNLTSPAGCDLALCPLAVNWPQTGKAGESYTNYSFLDNIVL